jgi:hypothetical protein
MFACFQLGCKPLFTNDNYCYIITSMIRESKVHFEVKFQGKKMLVRQTSFNLASPKGILKF